MADDFSGAGASAEEIADTLTVSASTFSRVLSTGLKNAVSEGYNLQRVLSRAALSISAASLKEALSPLTSLIGKGVSGVMGGFANALAGGGTKVLPFAQGGVIGAPTMFGMSGGRVGLMGEAGREAVLPLARGPDGRLGVGLEGGGGGTTINVSINTPDVQGFSRSEAQVTSMLARAVARGRRGL